MFASSRKCCFQNRQFLAGLWLALLAGILYAAEAALDVDVPAGKWKGVRLRNLPQGASVALQIESSAALRVIVVDGAELKRFPNTRALFTGSVERRLGFSVIIPRIGDYFVVLDNRASQEVRRVRLRIHAQPPQRQSPERREGAPGKPSLENT